MIFVAHQHGHRAPFPLGLGESDGDAVGVLVGLHQIVVDVEGVEEPFGVEGGGVVDDAVAGPAPVAYHHHHRRVHPEAPAAQGVARFHHPGVLDEDDGFFAAGGQPGGGGESVSLAAHRHQVDRGFIAHQHIEEVGFAVGEPDHMGDAVVFQFRQDAGGAQFGHR